MNGTQTLIAALYGGFVLVSLVAAILVIRSTRRPRLGEPDLPTITRRENLYGVGAVGLLAVLLAATAFAIPYTDTSGGGSAQVVEVTAFQFGWKLAPDTVTAGEPVEFRVRSQDVQHGFGLYRGAEFLAQVQVGAPDVGSGGLGPEQRLVHTFDEPGDYEINCLEFCGLNHHAMVAVLHVTGG